MESGLVFPAFAVELTRSFVGFGQLSARENLVSWTSSRLPLIRSAPHWFAQDISIRVGEIAAVKQYEAAGGSVWIKASAGEYLFVPSTLGERRERRFSRAEALTSLLKPIVGAPHDSPPSNDEIDATLFRLKGLILRPVFTVLILFTLMSFLANLSLLLWLDFNLPLVISSIIFAVSVSFFAWQMVHLSRNKNIRP